jgi:acyl-CoA synthetase (AMP-forming)/AMP-acid ligase II
VIVPVSGEPGTLIRRLRDVREDGGVPLVTDERWSPAQRDAILAAATAVSAPRDAAWATLTSGSSGSPRLVLRTAESWSSSFATVAELLDADSGSAVLLPAPATSSLTLFSLAHAIDGGPRPVLRSPGAARDDADPTCLHGTPQALRAVLEEGRPPVLRAALIGGSRLDPPLRARAEAAGIRVTAYYGAAELSFVALDTGDGLRPFPGVDIDVREGELWVRSPFTALGYASGSGPLRRDGEWATVGDRAELKNGRLRLLGRADDAILSASATVVPEEVEGVLRSVHGIRDAVVFGLPQGRVGALVAAFVELDAAAAVRSHDAPHPAGDSRAAASIAARLRAASLENLAPAHRPRRWFAGVLPRTASGKPARAEAARRAGAGEVERLVV